MEEIIQVENLRKKYGAIKAVDGISFTVKRGEIFGFLGPNGAGKTTTINILCTLNQPSSGVVYINNYNVVAHPDKVRSFIGLVFQDVTLDDHLTAEENLYLHAMLYGISRKDFTQRKIEVLKICELWDWRKHKVHDFSGGMKRRLEIARSLIAQPKILFLDEPTIGLDPQTRKKVWDYIFNIRKKKDITIFLTTQYLNEAESCDRVAIIDHGKIIASDTPENLKKMVGGDIITIKTEDNDSAEEEFHQKFPQYNIKKIGKELKIEIDKGNEFLPVLVENLNAKIISMELRRPTLEDVFLELTGRQIRENDNGHIETESPLFDLSSLFTLFNPSHNHDKKTKSQ
ncbi:MAG: ATP-binding cassette domain-containing protein [Parcubacteria group bacterium]|nr:ATP-binding cassette domain-containing protein [Parcubacteria group bacterium]